MTENTILGTLAIFRKRSTLFSCGYCKDNGKRNFSHGCLIQVLSFKIFESLLDRGWSRFLGLVAIELSPLGYNIVMDRGWRRSGNYLYKPIMNKTCCPQYTIRLNLDKFELSKSHKKVLKNVKRYLEIGECQTRKINEENIYLPIKKTKNVSNIETSQENIEKSKKMSKKKNIRRERALQKLKSKGIDIDEYQMERRKKEENRKKTLANYIEEIKNIEGKHKLQFRLVYIGSDSFKETKQESYNVYKKYQEVIHKDSNNSEANWHDFLCCGNIFKGFKNNGTSNITYGAYHYQYILNNNIIAVSVLDILPHLISAKYFYYDPQYSFLNLGTFSALHEIYFAQTLHATDPKLKYYYMGFYIHNCPKMRYKANFRPSELLCDQSYRWMDLKEATDMIEKNNGHFTVFYPDDKNIEKIDLDRVRFINPRKEIHGYRSMALQAEYEYLNDPYQREVIQYIMDRIGKACYNMKFFIIGERINYDSDSD
ncbi:Arginyl-tRNA--protein transferase 1 [Strongyloides ratti]|uniref:Arginyl-tRNA--protein transferase 1 n=1 Tax=Strongyloides ratti TaxID=34506 RepID=A0A090L6X9_STRRB|nr:Arginyl-tRNA--protein transferase 1 [Strongyloides ratti]CEF63878.1 Arginyl-tRNA--protein transferase 1 [Strongyloides ratti]